MVPITDDSRDWFLGSICNVLYFRTKVTASVCLLIFIYTLVYIWWTSGSGVLDPFKTHSPSYLAFIWRVLIKESTLQWCPSGSNILVISLFTNWLISITILQTIFIGKMKALWWGGGFTQAEALPCLKGDKNVLRQNSALRSRTLWGLWAPTCWEDEGQLTPLCVVAGGRVSLLRHRGGARF